MDEEIIFNAKQSNYTPEEIKRRKLERRTDGDSDSGYREVKLSQKQYDELVKAYECVSVHDFEDDYHLTHEEREEKNKFYEAFSQIMKCKKKYRRIDEFIQVYRKYINCLKVVAESNAGFYSTEEFMRKVLQGKIEVFGLRFPVYTGKDRKDINWNMVSEYIMDNSLDPSDLIQKHVDVLQDLKYMDDEELDDYIEKNYGSNDYIEKFYKDCDNVEEAEKLDFVLDADNLPEGNYVGHATKKDTKKLVEECPEIIKMVRNSMKSKSSKSRSFSESYLFDMVIDDMMEIENSDKRKGIITDTQMPTFKGNLLKDKDYKKYLYSLKEWEDNNIRYNYHGNYKTQSEINELELKDMLEEAGWNIRKLYNNAKEEKKLKKAYKKDKEREKELKRKLTAIQERNNKRKGKKDGSNEKDEMKFNSKKKNKKKKKALKKVKEKASKEFDDILLDAVSKDEYESYKDYSKNMKDFTYDSIFK